jgi:lipopolysaccharide transport system ATP-binding protein
MADDTVIELADVGKSYSLESRPWRRLWQQLRGTATTGQQHHALRHVDLRIRRGEVVGVVGRNGAGKSTMLQIICGVLAPTSGRRRVRGRIAALLELGAGFNPELTGRENVRLNGPLLGLTQAQMDARLPGIIEFAGIGEFIDQPVRSYSSGMFVRLAFSMATSVEPDILVIDEALSVGDGSFARKSFDRIMALKERGATILFCSHSLFQVEQLCERAIWLHDGGLRFDGPSRQACMEYQGWMDATQAGAGQDAAAPTRFDSPAAALLDLQLLPVRGGLELRSGVDELALRIRARSDPALPEPTVGVVVHGADGRALASAGSWIDEVDLRRDADGGFAVILRFPALPLLKGRYTVSIYVLCERAIHIQAAAEHALAFEVLQSDAMQGVVALPRRWQTGSEAKA